MLSAEERVVWLLRTTREVRQSYTRASTGEGVRLMPAEWNAGSYDELERRMVQLRESPLRYLWWHVSYRYLWGTVRLIIAPVVRRRTGPEFHLPPHCELVAGGAAVGTKHAEVRVYEWPAVVEEKYVAQGVRWLVDHMYDGAKHNIVLSEALLNRALGNAITYERERVTA